MRRANRRSQKTVNEINQLMDLAQSADQDLAGFGPAEAAAGDNLSGPASKWAPGNELLTTAP
ncbi:hypothetical protein [Oceanibacterium hippocampi]|uniref:hypothetical protein n=1 Tax=Oceanibacterium hippocampi TaxID=745714 RepID=UPI00111C449F|nr:hypothetical protein [Oceanibacterium hippocampi]